MGQDVQLAIRVFFDGDDIASILKFCDKHNIKYKKRTSGSSNNFLSKYDLEDEFINLSDDGSSDEGYVYGDAITISNDDAVLNLSKELNGVLNKFRKMKIPLKDCRVFYHLW